MTQASDLGGIANQLAAFYRARVNVNLQAVTTQHYGSSEPPVMYPNMLWFDSGTGYVKLRNPTNPAWGTVGTIGPPMKWTNVDIPQTAFTTGDVKMTYKVTADAGWVMMNDGTIGDGSSGAYTRANPDTQALFTLLWNTTSDDWCSVLAAGTGTRTGKGASAASDWAAHRHLILPKALGRAFSGAGSGAGLSGFGVATWWGAETVGLDITNMPSHVHSFTTPAHAHGLARQLPNYVGGKSSSSGGYTLADQQSGIGTTNTDGAASGNTSAAGSGVAHFNIQPTTYLNVMIKL